MEKADAPTGREGTWDEFTDEEPAGERGRLTLKLSVVPQSSLSAEEVSEVGVPGNHSELLRFISWFTRRQWDVGVVGCLVVVGALLSY